MELATKGFFMRGRTHAYIELGKRKERERKLKKDVTALVEVLEKKPRKPPRTFMTRAREKIES